MESSLKEISASSEEHGPWRPAPFVRPRVLTRQRQLQCLCYLKKFRASAPLRLRVEEMIAAGHGILRRGGKFDLSGHSSPGSFCSCFRAASDEEQDRLAHQF